MEWEKKIFGMIANDEWLNVGTNVTRPNDPADQLFGDERTNNLVAKWQSIASEFQIPVSVLRPLLASADGSSDLRIRADSADTVKIPKNIQCIFIQFTGEVCNKENLWNG